MDRLADKFQKLRENQEIGLILFVNGGDPDLETTGQILRIVERQQLAAIEIGIPFPNSPSDGPIILRSHERALKKQIVAREVVQLIGCLRNQLLTPIVLFVDYDYSISAVGLKEFIYAAKDNGIDGLLVSQLPLPLLPDLARFTKECHLSNILSISPLTSWKMRQAIYQVASGYIYLVSRVGKTGPQEELPTVSLQFIQKIRQETALPIAIGFGISKREHLQQLAALQADAAIVGSAFIAFLEQALQEHPPHNLATKIQDFVSRIK